MKIQIVIVILIPMRVIRVIVKNVLFSVVYNVDKQIEVADVLSVLIENNNGL